MTPPPPPGARPDRSGAAGETLAARWLQARGYRLVARDLRTRHGEIDLLVRRRRIWIAVEVKARADHPAPERHVDDERLDRLGRALLALAPSLQPVPRQLQIDVVAIRWQQHGATEVRHFAGARVWLAGTDGRDASPTERWRRAVEPVYSSAPKAPCMPGWSGACRRLVRALLRTITRWRPS